MKQDSTIGLSTGTISRRQKLSVRCVILNLKLLNTDNVSAVVRNDFGLTINILFYLLRYNYPAVMCIFRTTFPDRVDESIIRGKLEVNCIKQLRNTHSRLM
jgi:hypothetical protein